MFKLAAIAVVATIATAMPSDIKEATLLHGDFPMPVVPWDFEATSYEYIYTVGGRLRPSNLYRSQRVSSALNRIYEVEGAIDEDGNEIVTSVESTDATSRTAVEYNVGKPCVTATDVQVGYVNQTIHEYFNGYTYAGAQYAPWELTRVKYFRLDGNGVQYFYKQSNLSLRFFVELFSETEYRVHDFSNGLQEKTFSTSDFVVDQCQQAPEVFLQ